MRILPSLRLIHWFFLTLIVTFFAIFLLLAAPSPAKANHIAGHNPSCTITSGGIAPGGDVTVRFSDVEADQDVAAFGGPFFNDPLGKTPNTVDTTGSRTYATDPAIPAGTYQVDITWAFHVPPTTLCGGTFTVSSAPPPPPPGGCQVDSYLPNPASLGGNLAIKITGDLGSRTYAAGLANSDDTPLSPSVRVTKAWDLTLANPLTIDVTVPATLDTSKTYKIVAVVDASSPLVICATAPGLALLSVTPASGSTTGTCPTTVTNDVEAINKLNCTWISAGTFDDKPFIKNQFFGLLDAGYLGITGLSRLNPEGDGVTAGSGALAASGRMITALYSKPPVSGVSYLAGEFGKFNPVQPAYAQEGGIGYAALAPVQRIWEAFRNISYVGFIIVFVITGFMIMFRAHISPQAVATVQDSLPRIVIALILVTFSYAIAGLMIDLMFLLLNVFINALREMGLLPNYNDNIFTKSVFGIVWGSWTDTFKTVADAIANVIDETVSVPVLDKILGFFGGTIGAIVVGIAILFIMFRVFFMLLVAYATIIIMTIAAPFYFLFQALPGNNGAKDWFKQMAANVAVFPATALMFVLAGIIGGIPSLGGPPGGIIGSGDVGQFPLLTGGLSTDAIGRLIGIGLLLMTPSAAEMVKKAIGAQTPAGASFAPGAAALGASAGFLGRRAADNSYVRGIAEAREVTSQQRITEAANRIPPFMRGGRGQFQATPVNPQVRARMRS